MESKHTALKQKGRIVTDVLHIFILSSFAFAQPLFDLLSRNAEFFIVRRSEPVDVVLLVLILCILIPVVIILIELIAGFFGEVFRKAVHGAVTAILIMLIALAPMGDISWVPGAILLTGAVISGMAAAVIYMCFNAVRQYLTIMLPVLLIFPGLFLFDSQIYRVVFKPETVPTAYHGVDSTTPVIMVVFDELPLTSLMDEHHRIDPNRYPNFAAFAKEACWFRKATTVHTYTSKSLIDILTGNYPVDGRLPIAFNYPDNLFALFGSSYDMKVVEGTTQLLPPRFRGNDKTGENLAKRMHSLLSDLSVIYLHVLLPEDLTSFLPDVKSRWKNFTAQKTMLSNSEETLNFIKSICDTEKPTLYFLHSFLPHNAWVLMPSGKIYENREEIPPAEFSDDEWKTIHYYQRHLLQVEYVDRLLGEIIARLKDVGLYDRSLVVVLADHGVSFMPGTSRRLLTKSSCHDILPIPLIIKKPYQREGEIIDRNMQTFDILPTIADILGFELPWKTAGRSAFDTSMPERTQIGTINLKQCIQNMDITLMRKLDLFGLGEDTDSLFRIGPYKNLIGGRISELSVNSAERAKVELDSKNYYENIDPEDRFVPCLITGRVIAGEDTGSSYNLAVSVNGIIRAVIQTFKPEGNVAKFSAVVPETSFRAGKNSIEVVVLSRVKKHLQDSITYSLSDKTITSSDGKTFRIIPKAILGYVDNAVVQEDRLTFNGWAADVKNSRIPEAVLIFVRGEFLYSGRIALHRPSIGQYFDNNAIVWSGFRCVLPLKTFKGIAPRDVHFFAISKTGVASELKYRKKYKWAAT